MSEHPKKTVTVRIEGMVQGVFYRAWTEQNARELGLDGSVRNSLDGSVEAVFSGPANYVEEMLERCLTGPPDAMVSAVIVLHQGGSVQPGFRVLPTG